MPLHNTPVGTAGLASEHDRLQRRTDELYAEHNALALAKTPFNQANHDAHQRRLRQHHADLRAHSQRLMCSHGPRPHPRRDEERKIDRGDE